MVSQYPLYFIGSAPPEGELQERFASLMQAMQEIPPPLQGQIYWGDSPIAGEQAFIIAWAPQDEKEQTLLLDYLMRRLFRLIMNKLGKFHSIILSLGENTPSLPVHFSIADWEYLANQAEFEEEYEQNWESYFATLKIDTPTPPANLEANAAEQLQGCLILEQLCAKTPELHASLLKELSLLEKIPAELQKLQNGKPADKDENELHPYPQNLKALIALYQALREADDKEKPLYMKLMHHELESLGKMPLINTPEAAQLRELYFAKFLPALAQFKLPADYSLASQVGMVQRGEYH